MSETARVTEALERGIGRLVQRLGLDVNANLIARTPVDTGWARANWLASIGAPIERDLSAVDPNTGIISSARGEQASGQAAIATRYNINQGSIFIVNNVPYIIFLNFGSSAQAPAMFVEQAISDAITGLNGAVIR